VNRTSNRFNRDVTVNPSCYIDSGVTRLKRAHVSADVISNIAIRLAIKH